MIAIVNNLKFDPIQNNTNKFKRFNRSSGYLCTLNMFIVHQPPYQSGNLHFHGTCASTKQLLFGINHDIPMGRTALHLICSMRNCDCLAIPNLERRQPDMSLESLPITSTKLNVYKISSHLATAQVVRHPTYYSVFRQVLTRWQLATKRQS